MPSLRERDATEALADLTNHHMDDSTARLIDIAKSLCPFGPDDDLHLHNDKIEHYIEVPDGEDLSGSTSTSPH